MFLRSYAEAKLYTDETTTTWVRMQVIWDLLCDTILRLHIEDLTSVSTQSHGNLSLSHILILLLE